MGGKQRLPQIELVKGNDDAGRELDAHALQLACRRAALMAATAVAAFKYYGKEKKEQSFRFTMTTIIQARAPRRDRRSAVAGRIALGSDGRNRRDLVLLSVTCCTVAARR